MNNLQVFLYVVVIFAAFAGFLLAFFIRHKKQSKETMICPLKSNCNAVIYSEYSRFLGVPVELLGITYYALAALIYGAFLISPALAATPLAFFVLLVTTAAFFFSLYLTFIQAFFLKQWCTWCLLSAGLGTIIFLAVLLGSGMAFIPFLAVNFTYLYTFHFLGIVAGLAAATVADALFFNFLKDFRISQWESVVLRFLSQIIWLALALVLITGAGFYLPFSELLNQSPQFLLKAAAVLVLVISGAFYNLLIGPKLIQLSFKRTGRFPAELRHLRQLGFALGATSLVSWYLVFFLEVTNLPQDFIFLLMAYLALVVTAVVISQIIENSLAQKARIQ